MKTIKRTAENMNGSTTGFGLAVEPRHVREGLMQMRIIVRRAALAGLLIETAPVRVGGAYGLVASLERRGDVGPPDQADWWKPAPSPALPVSAWVAVDFDGDNYTAEPTRMVSLVPYGPYGVECGAGEPPRTLNAGALLRLIDEATVEVCGMSIDVRSGVVTSATKWHCVSRDMPQTVGCPHCGGYAVVNAARTREPGDYDWWHVERAARELAEKLGLEMPQVACDDE